MISDITIIFCILFTFPTIFTYSTFITAICISKAGLVIGIKADNSVWLLRYLNKNDQGYSIFFISFMKFFFNISGFYKQYLVLELKGKFVNHIS